MGGCRLWWWWRRRRWFFEVEGKEMEDLEGEYRENLRRKDVRRWYGVGGEDVEAMVVVAGSATVL